MAIKVESDIRFRQLLPQFGDLVLVSDNELLGLYVYKDDHSAFEKLIRRHSDMVLAVCSSLLWQKADAEDAFQAVFILLSAKAPKLLKHNSVGGWLHETAFRTSLKHRGKILRKREVEMSEQLKSNTKEPWETIAESRDTELLHREISRLPKRYRNVIVLCHLEGKSRAQAASILDVTTASVKAALARGRKLLRQRLLKHGIAASMSLGAVVASADSAGAAATGVSESLIQSTMHHCQGLSPELIPADLESVGNGAEVIQSLLQKDLSMMNMGLAQGSLAAATGVVAVCVMSIAAVASQLPLKGEGVINVEGPVAIQTANSLSTFAPQEAIETFSDPAEGNRVLAERRRNNELTALEAELLRLQMELADLNSRLGSAHPQIVLVESRIDKIKKQIEAAPVPLPNPAAKKATETWGQYVDRLSNVEVISDSQRTEWLSGSKVEVTRQIPVARIYREFRTRKVPTTRMKKELRGGVEVEVPYVEMETRHYNVQVPYTELKTMVLTIPAQGTQPEDAVTPGFVETDPSTPSIKPAAGTFNGQKFKGYDVMKMIVFEPRQSGAVFEKIKQSEAEEYTVRRTSANKVTSFQLVTKKTKRVLRKLVDINNDGKIDSWIYYKDGVETYRDMDLDFNGKVDQSQFINGDRIRYGIDEDEDGKIDRWEKGRLSEIQK